MDALETVVERITQVCRRKGAEFKGPHSDSPEQVDAPLYARLDGDSDVRYPDWSYSVYQRRLELRGHEEVARDILKWDFPQSVKVEVTVEQFQSG